jgi:hypothetical protein
MTLRQNDFVMETQLSRPSPNQPVTNKNVQINNVMPKSLSWQKASSPSTKFLQLSLGLMFSGLMFSGLMSSGLSKKRLKKLLGKAFSKSM